MLVVYSITLSVERLEGLAKDDVGNLTLGERTQDDIENIKAVDLADEWAQLRLNMAMDMCNT